MEWVKPSWRLTRGGGILIGLGLHDDLFFEASLGNINFSKYFSITNIFGVISEQDNW